MTLRGKILDTLRQIRIDHLQAEMNRIGLFPNDKYAALLVDKINAAEMERAEDLAEYASPIMKKDGV